MRASLPKFSFNLFSRPRDVSAIQYREVASYAELLNNAEPAILWIYEPRASPGNLGLLFGELANKEVCEEHASTGPAPTGFGLACLNNVLVSGSSLTGTSTEVYQLGPVAPDYVDLELGKHPHSNEPPVLRRDLAWRRERFVPGLSVLLTHWNSNTYGHWLLECLPKLLLLRRIANRLPPLCIVLPRSIASWIVTWIKYVLPGVAVEIYDNRFEYLCCEKLLLPTTPMYGVHFHPEFNSLLEDLHPASSVQRTTSNRLYISKTVQSHFRELSNRVEIEDIAVSEGLTLVTPETMSIHDQIELFANANLIVGEFGSSMHNTLFSPSGAKVFCLNWINSLQCRIAQLRGHQVGYLLPSDGVPVKYVFGAPRLAYHINPKLFRQCVRSLIAS